jgi:hypothetical protein
MDTATGEETMRQCIRIVWLLALGGALLWAQPLPDAAAILDRYVEVTGGRAAYEKHQTEVLTGVVEFAAQGLKGKITRYSAPPDREYSMVDLEGIGLVESGVYAGAAWEKSVLLGPRIKAGEEKDQAIREAHFNAPLEWRKLYPQAATVGAQTIDGEDCYEVILTPPTGKPEHQFYSRKTGLLVRTTAVAASQMGEVNVEVDVAEYKTFGGVLGPTRSRQRAGSQELTITVDQIRVNEALPPERFEPPADVAAMIRKAAVAQ